MTIYTATSCTIPAARTDGLALGASDPNLVLVNGGNLASSDDTSYVLWKGNTGGFPNLSVQLRFDPIDLTNIRDLNVILTGRAANPNDVTFNYSAGAGSRIPTAYFGAYISILDSQGREFLQLSDQGGFGNEMSGTLKAEEWYGQGNCHGKIFTRYWTLLAEEADGYSLYDRNPSFDPSGGIFLYLNFRAQFNYYTQSTVYHQVQIEVNKISDPYPADDPSTIIYAGLTNYGRECEYTAVAEDGTVLYGGKFDKLARGQDAGLIIAGNRLNSFTDRNTYSTLSSSFSSVGDTGLSLASALVDSAYIADEGAHFLNDLSILPNYADGTYWAYFDDYPKSYLAEIDPINHVVLNKVQLSTGDNLFPVSGGKIGNTLYAIGNLLGNTSGTGTNGYQGKSLLTIDLTSGTYTQYDSVFPNIKTQGDGLPIPWWLTVRSDLNELWFLCSEVGTVPSDSNAYTSLGIYRYGVDLTFKQSHRFYGPAPVYAGWSNHTALSMEFDSKGRLVMAVESNLGGNTWYSVGTPGATNEFYDFSLFRFDDPTSLSAYNTMPKPIASLASYGNPGILRMAMAPKVSLSGYLGDNMRRFR